MAVHDAQSRQLAANDLRSTTGAILVTDAVKAIAMNALLIPCIRAGVDSGFEWHMTVKGRIENGYLWHTGQKMLCHLDSFQINRIMQGREGSQFSNGFLHLPVDEDAAGVLASAMHDAVSHHCDLLWPRDHGSRATPQRM